MTKYFYQDSNGLYHLGISIIPSGAYKFDLFKSNTIISVVSASNDDTIILDSIEITNLLKENGDPYADLDELLTAIGDIFSSGSVFVLTDGIGTTANGTAIDLGGSVNGAINFEGGAGFSFGIPTNHLNTFTVFAKNTLGINLVGGGDILLSEAHGEIAIQSSNISSAWYNASSEFVSINLSSLGVTIESDITGAGLAIPIAPSGATQGAAGAAANEVWVTVSHATLPDGVVMRGV